MEDPAQLLGQADLVLKVQPPSTSQDGRDEAAELKEGAAIISFLYPAKNEDLVRRLAERRISAIAMDTVPRITRAQSMDALSSQSTVAGYKAVLVAAHSLNRMMPLLMTAAGTIRPATVLVIGAGVAGLQAIATARRLGANVLGIDTRPAVAEQVQSLGAKFIALEVDHSAEDAGGYATDLGEAFYKQEQEIIAPHAAKADIIITTAIIPGRPAPKLLPENTLESMKPGSVIVDLASVAGGNCSLTRPDERVESHGVIVLGPTNLPAAAAVHASQMYARNVAALLEEYVDEEGAFVMDRENEVIAGTLITHEGRVVHEQTARAAGLEDPQPENPS